MKRSFLVCIFCLYALCMLSQETSSEEYTVRRCGIAPSFGVVSSEALYLFEGLEIDYHASQSLAVYANYHLLYLQLYDNDFSINIPMQTTSIGLKVDIPSNRMSYRVGFSYNQLTNLPSNYIEGIGMDLGLTFYILQSDWYTLGANFQETYIPETQKGLSQAQFIFRLKF